jgi:hypothetical protein
LVGVRNFALVVKFQTSFGKKRIFQRSLSFKQLLSKKLTPQNFRCIIKKWKISCRYVFVFIKLNFIVPIDHNLKFWEAKSSVPLVKCVFVKMYFTKEMLDFAPQKLRLWLIGLMEFKDENISTWNLPTFYDTPKILWRQFLRPKFLHKNILLKNPFFPNKIWNFTIKSKFLTPTNIRIEC